MIEITDSGGYAETLTISTAANQQIKVRAADKASPTLILGGPLTMSGAAGSSVTLNGLRIAGVVGHVRQRNGGADKNKGLNPPVRRQL